MALRVKTRGVFLLGKEVRLDLGVFGLERCE
ncbi:hypothetical protein KS4_36220 [Poriferisphaera corsica]|uniref:Uncharacterized protein n=1 Tax=Poriferisphaera corsica TaxID=2528020 RepID=A0A517YZB6_9BACT|nr:hypothetical protein KS4_36220 [Poriferisphaera corsica]